MPTFFANTYGGYVYGNAIATYDDGAEYRSRTATPVGIGGKYTAGTRFDSLSVNMEGKVQGTDSQTLRDAMDALRAAHAPGLPRRLYLDSDRYCNAEVTTSIKPQPSKGLPFRRYSFTLTAYDDPPWFADTPTTVPLGVGANNFTVGGGGPADPVLTLTTGGGGGTITITDGAGNVCAFSPIAAAVYTLDSLAYTVTDATGADRFGLVTDGDLLRLVPGANTWTVATAGGASLTSVSLVYQPRWY